MIRVLVVDDQPLYREGVCAVLAASPGLKVVGEAANGHEALAECARQRPHVILMDLHMPIMDGVVATRRLRLQHPEARIVVLTVFADDAHVLEALRAGAIGYLLKDVTGERLREAVSAAARGESLLAAAAATHVVAELRRAPLPKVLELETPLSAREQEVLSLLARGASNKEIGKALFISEGTVKNHVTAIFGKLAVSDRTQAALKARDLGLS
jgi:DNA-binding NarL/FixJ family response regulator